jgi:hypothetical protein
MKRIKMLKDIFRKYRCDKKDHMYYEVYEKWFENKKNEPLNILEIGIFKGVSMDAWREYLPNANIFGIDVFTRLKPEEVPALKKDRVHWLKSDSTKNSVQSAIKEKWGDVIFDVIIDDGLHTPEANANTFENLIPLLKDDGVFYIEDIWPLDIMTDQEWKHSWMARNKAKYNMDKWKVFENALVGYNVERIDLRKESAIPDSYIFKVTK